MSGGSSRLCREDADISISYMAPDTYDSRPQLPRELSGVMVKMGVFGVIRCSYRFAAASWAWGDTVS